ncbi:MAG: hypothetical protein KGH72_01225 [Candidatus Micrarchaeota archaeon]|nr:hypothetical protein [Candidatus Micrarchaeota archaeon]
MIDLRHHYSNVAAEDVSSEPQAPSKVQTILQNKYVAIIVVIALLIAIAYFTIIYRISLLQFFGFYEPDGFYHFSVVRAAINNGFAVPKALGISGWPQHAPVGEPDGLYWITLVPYFIIGRLGVSYYTIMRLIPILFAFLDILGAYLLSRYMSKDRLFGLLAMLFVALSLGDAARTSGTIYRGDTFLPFFFILALVFAIEVSRAQKRNWKIIFCVASAVLLSVCNLVWNGAPFATAAFIVSLMVLLFVAYIWDRENLLHDCGYLIATLVIWFVLVRMYLALGYISIQTFTGFDFIPILVMIIAFWALLYWLSKNRMSFIMFTKNAIHRMAFVFIVSIVGTIAFYVAFPSTVTAIFVTNGFIITNNFGATIQELQPPTSQFLFASFGYSLLTTPMSAFIWLASVLPQSSLVILLIWLIAVLSFIPYFFMQVYDSGTGLLSGKAKIRFDINPGFIVVFSYFILTAYLEMHAIRFNSLLSVPLAIMSAYTLYWLLSFSLSLSNRRAMYVTAAAMLLFMVLIGVVLVYYDGIYGSNLSPADSINPSFISALQWFKGNSANSSVVLTLWPDGSLVEGVANRTSVTDSVGSQNGTKALPFATWILNSSDDPRFLLSPINGKPDYLLVRTPWLLETDGIYVESGLNPNNTQAYGLESAISFTENENSTNKLLGIKTPQGNFTVNIARNLTTNGTSISAYLPGPNGNYYFDAVAFFDIDNSNFSIFTNPYRTNKTINQSVIVMYSGKPRPGLFINLTGSYVMEPGLANSNMIKWLFFCNTYACVWDNNIAKLRMVYYNQDTKIFRIIYNSTANSTA